MKLKKTVEHTSTDFPKKFGAMFEVGNVQDFYEMLKWASDTFKYTPEFGQDQDYWAPTGYFWFSTEQDRNWFVMRWL